MSREVPVNHLNCQYLKHIGRSDRCVVPAVSAVFKTHTISGDIMKLRRLFGAENGAEDLTVMRNGLAFLSTVRNDPQFEVKLK